MPLQWKKRYFARIKDLIDQYHPDLMYTDGPIFFDEWGLALMARNKAAMLTRCCLQTSPP